MIYFRGMLSWRKLKSEMGIGMKSEMGIGMNSFPFNRLVGESYSHSDSDSDSRKK